MFPLLMYVCWSMAVAVFLVSLVKFTHCGELYIAIQFSRSILHLVSLFSGAFPASEVGEKRQGSGGR